MLNSVTHILHESGKVIVRSLLCLISLCVPVTADAQNKLIISGFDTANIDGIKQSGEWSRAGRMVFDARMEGLESDRKAFAILYAMNSRDHFFLGLVAETGVLGTGWLKLSLKMDAKTSEFYFNPQSGLLVQGPPADSPDQSMNKPDCCRARVGSSQGYEMFEFEHSFDRENSNTGLTVSPGGVFDLQMSVVSCTNLPGADDCWESTHDAFITESGMFEVGIQLASGPDG